MYGLEPPLILISIAPSFSPLHSILFIMCGAIIASGSSMINVNSSLRHKLLGSKIVAE